MQKYYGVSYFEHWSRDEKGFNLVSPSKQRAIRCESNRIIIRAEGGSSTRFFEELLPLMKDIISTFEANDIFAVAFTTTRVLPAKNLKQARGTFAERFMAPASLNLLKTDHRADYASVVQRDWMANRELDEVTAINDPGTVLDMQENINLGPVTREEIAERFLEFKPKAANSLYSVEPATPPFGIAADMKFTAKQHTPAQALDREVIWDVYSWAKNSSDDIWTKIAGAR